MAIPAGLTHFVLSGSLSSDAEVFATGWWEDGWAESDWNDATHATNWWIAGPSAAFANAIRSVLSTTDVLAQLDVYYYNGGSAASRHQVAIGGGAGSAAESLPLQTCCVLTTRTGLAGRSKRGRMYIPYRGVALTTASLMNTSAVNSLVDTFAAYCTASVTATHPPVVLSKALSSSAPITSIDADYKVDIQRRRAQQQSGGVRHSVNV